VLGPAIVVSPGGVWVELFEAASQVRLAPLSFEEADAMVKRSGALEKLLAGFRGRPPADRPALVNFIVDFSRLVEGLDDNVLAIDLNPVMVLPQSHGVTIIDAAIERARPEAP